MSATAQATAAAVLHELVIAIQGRDATKYLTVAGLVILIYDHMLLFGEETRLIWVGKRSWTRFLFLFNRYTVPAYILVGAYQVSGMSAGSISTTFCKTWLSTMGILNTTTLAITNVFVVLRVHALWGGNRRILSVMISAFTLTYLCVLGAAIYAIVTLSSHISYSVLLDICVIDEVPKINIAAFAAPLVFDIFLFGLMCWNALDRPRYMQTAVVKQLFYDGAVYFIITLTLRLFNISILAAANIAYVELGFYFLWAMVTALINRMLITISSTVEKPQSIEPSGDLRPQGQLETPFEILATMSAGGSGSSDYPLTSMPGHAKVHIHTSVASPV